MQSDIRVRPVVRYIITRYSCDPDTLGNGQQCASCETLGEFDSEMYAEQVARALRSHESEKERWESHVRMENGSREAAVQAVSEVIAQRG